MERAVKWAILCSGRGGNAIDVIKKLAIKGVEGFEIALLIYDNDDCMAAEIAKKLSIESLKIRRSDYSNSKDHQGHITLELNKREIDLIFMMNYKYLIRKSMLKAFPERIINVHPSLFPSFLATTSAIQDALAYGVRITGITTHIIDEFYDQGEILFQEPIKVELNDTFETLYPKFKKKGKKIIINTMKEMSTRYKKINSKAI